jgi:hypothetical protein
MKKAIPWLVLIALLVAGGAWYITSREPADTHPSFIPLSEEPQPTPEPEGEFPVENILPATEPDPEPEPLPPLADSDAAMTEALAGLFGPESLEAYFVLEQVISRIVATIDSLTSREIAPLVMPLKQVAGKFVVLSAGESLAISPENELRYLPYVTLAQQTDTEALTAAYVNFYPLFQEAYAALGYQDAYFNDRLIEVIDHLLSTPEVAGPVRLVKPEAVYLYEDEALEALSAGQKAMLRIGPENTAVIRAKLQEIRAAVSRQQP